MENNNNDIKYSFSHEDISLFTDRLEYVKDLFFVIDEVYKDKMPEDILEAMNSADDAIIRIEALISARVNRN